MLRLIGNRLLYSLPLLFVVSTFSYVLQSLVHGDLARTILGIRGTPEQYQSLRKSLGLDEATPVVRVVSPPVPPVRAKPLADLHLVSGVTPT